MYCAESQVVLNEQNHAAKMATRCPDIQRHWRSRDESRTCRSVSEELEPREGRIVWSIEGPVFVRIFLKAINGDDRLGFHLGGLASAVRAGNAVTRVFAVL